MYYCTADYLRVMKLYVKSVTYIIATTTTTTTTTIDTAIVVTTQQLQQ